ncbi:MAG: [NiFe]-hydrogenase assembly chaperone HybE [Hyphomicrobiaceae bacterium]|nr:[NiFe]-hydrogenase assembly chaperone HybE [Hyphomicrobiaceae bacterium]
MCELLVEHYSMVETTRMDGVPILNNTLSVAAIGFEEFGDFRLGIMLTPWFMNLMLLPKNEEVIDTKEQKFGSTQHHALPSGQFAFIVGHEEELGPYLSCSLFSPVFEFEDQEAFEQTAQAVLGEVLTPAVEKSDEELDEDELAEVEMRELWAGRKPEPEPVVQEEGAEGSDPNAKDVKKEDERPVRKLPTMSSQMSRRDVLRGLKAPEDEPEIEKHKQKEPS